MSCSQSLAEDWVWVAEVDADPLLRGVGFCLFPSDLGMKPHNREFPSVYLCGKGDPQSLYLTLAYAKMQRAELFSLSPFSFLLRQKL